MIAMFYMADAILALGLLLGACGAAGLLALHRALGREGARRTGGSPAPSLDAAARWAAVREAELRAARLAREERRLRALEGFRQLGRAIARTERDIHAFALMLGQGYAEERRHLSLVQEVPSCD